MSICDKDTKRCSCATKKTVYLYFVTNVEQIIDTTLQQ